MNNEDQQLLNELTAKAKLSPAERAQLKNLNRKAQAEQKKAASTDIKKAANVFAVKSTTKVFPLPIRFLPDERAGLRTRADDLKIDSLDEIIEVLGMEGEREINETKLVRAAVYLLREHSNSEIINAIKQVKLQMLR